MTAVLSASVLLSSIIELHTSVLFGSIIVLPLYYLAVLQYCMPLYYWQYYSTACHCIIWQYYSTACVLLYYLEYQLICAFKQFQIQSKNCFQSPNIARGKTKEQRMPKEQLYTKWRVCQVGPRLAWQIRYSLV